VTIKKLINYFDRGQHLGGRQVAAIFLTQAWMQILIGQELR
jgi:hypothetical protein